MSDVKNNSSSSLSRGKIWYKKSYKASSSVISKYRLTPLYLKLACSIKFIINVSFLTSLIMKTSRSSSSLNGFTSYIPSKYLRSPIMRPSCSSKDNLALKGYSTISEDTSSDTVTSPTSFINAKASDKKVSACSCAIVNS